MRGWATAPVRLAMPWGVLVLVFLLLLSTFDSPPVVVGRSTPDRTSRPHVDGPARQADSGTRVTNEAGAIAADAIHSVTPAGGGIGVAVRPGVRPSPPSVALQIGDHSALPLATSVLVRHHQRRHTSASALPRHVLHCVWLM
jgi:hypothetical protein